MTDETGEHVVYGEPVQAQGPVVVSMDDGRGGRTLFTAKSMRIVPIFVVPGPRFSDDDEV